MAKSDMLIARYVRELLEEADVLMELDASVRDTRSLGSLNMRVDDHIRTNEHRLNPSRGERVKAVGDAFVRRSKNVGDVPATKAFSVAFGIERPPLSIVLKRSYTLELQMPPRIYETVCGKIGLGEYGFSEGLCPSADVLVPSARPVIGGSVTLIRYDRVPLAQNIIERMAQTDAFADPDGLVFGQYNLSALTQLPPDPVTQRHEEIHSAQNVMGLAAAYTFNRGSLKTSLMHEESATIISRAETNMEPHENPFLHTSFYTRTGTKYGDFQSLAKKLYPNRGRSKQIMEQRRAASYAAGMFYQDADAKLRKLAGWMFHLIGFKAVPEVLSMAKKIYEAS